MLVRCRLGLACVALAACTLNTVNYEGKRCLSTCPDGLVCITGECRFPDPMPALAPDASLVSAAVDAGFDAGQVDAGIAACSGKCSAGVERCMSNACVVIAGASCLKIGSGASTCEPGHYCSAGRCIRNDADFCSTIGMSGQASPGSFCDGFKASTLWSEWATEVAGTRTAPAVLSAVSRSPPYAFVASVGTPGYSSSQLKRNFASATFKKVFVNFDVRLNRLAMGKSTFVNLAQLLCRKSPSGSAGLFLLFRPNERLVLSMPLSDGGTNEGTLPQPLPAQEWTHVEMRIARATGRVDERLAGFIAFNGADPSQFVSDACNGNWEFKLGLEADDANAEVAYDNVTFNEVDL